MMHGMISVILQQLPAHTKKGGFMENFFDFINDFDSFETDFDYNTNDSSETFEDTAFDETTDDSFFATQDPEIFDENLNDNNDVLSFDGDNDVVAIQKDLEEDLFSEETPPLGGIFTDILFGTAEGLFNALLFTAEAGIDLAETTLEFWAGAAGGGILVEMLGSEMPVSDYETIDFNDIFSQVIPDNTDFQEYLSANDFINSSDYIETDDNFHSQECPNSCAIATITDIANDFGFDVSEAQLRDIAASQGIYDEIAGGTNQNALGDFIHNITGHETISGNFDINDLVDAINQGHKVIMAVDPLELSNTPAGIANMITENLAGREICNAGHAVEFKGIQYYDGEPYAVADNPDPTIGGHNIMYPLEQYLNASADFKNFAVIIK